MKKIALATLLAATTLVATAQVKAPESTLSFNVSGVSEYRYRGISQSRFDPALQAGADYAHKSGVYVGIWGSSIKWINDAGGNASTEANYFTGYKSTLGNVGYDIGFLRYDYSGNTLKPSADTDELYGAVTMGNTTLKYSQTTGNLFGFANSKGSSYVDLTTNFDLGNGYTFTPHIGHQTVKGAGNGIYSYTDAALTLGKDLGNGLTASAAIVGTDAKTGSYVSPSGKQLGKTGVVVGVKYTF